MSVNVKDVEVRLAECFKANPIFNENNIGKDNTVEDKTVGFVLKLKEVLNVSLDSFYERLKTFKLETLSSYSNKGLVTYDSLENTGKISLEALNDDDENNYNIDNLFGQIMLMILTSKDNYYGFGNERSLNALNETCTYLISSNLFGSAIESDFEEEITILNLLDVAITKANGKIDFITSYFSNNGVILKEQLNRLGINDDILNKINYLHEAKLNKRVVPEMFATILNDINKNILKNNPSMANSEDYKKHLLSDGCYKYSTVGVSGARENAIKAMDYMKSKTNNMVDISMKVAQKTA